MKRSPESRKAGKACVHCGEPKAKAEFPGNRSMRDGLSSWCRDCHAAATAGWRAKQREADDVLETEARKRHVRALRRDVARVRRLAEKRNRRKGTGSLMPEDTPLGFPYPSAPTIQGRGQTRVPRAVQEAVEAVDTDGHHQRRYLQGRGSRHQWPDPRPGSSRTTKV